jgi:hypothetical protein
LASRILRDPEAFSLDPSIDRKRRREKMPEHLSFIRGLACIVCGARHQVEPAHVRAPSPVHGKRCTGIGRKSDDLWTIPLCREHHRAQHAIGNELEFWESYGIDPFGVALALRACTGDDVIADAIIKLARRKGRIATHMTDFRTTAPCAAAASAK